MLASNVVLSALSILPYDQVRSCGTCSAAALALHAMCTAVACMP